MPLKEGSDAVSANIDELHGGKTFRRTKQKYGRKRANKQSIAIALNKAGKSRKRGRGKRA